MSLPKSSAFRATRGKSKKNLSNAPFPLEVINSFGGYIRIRSGIAAAKARGKRLGRQPGERPKSDRLAPKVLALIGLGRSYRLVGRELGLSKNTVADIVKRSRAATSGD